MSKTTTIIGRAPAPKRILKVLNGGANRGATENLDAFVGFNEMSAAAAIVPVYADPMPGRAIAMKDAAERKGVSAEALEARVEDVVASNDVDPTTPLVLNLDRASAIARVLRTIEPDGRPVLGYLMLRLPSGRLWALRFVLEPGDVEARRGAITFFLKLAEVSERNTSGEVLTADPAHILAEAPLRRWFAEHCRANLAKIVAGVEPVTNSFDVSMDGRERCPLHIVARDAWSDPAALAEEIVANPSSPLRRGAQFVVAEVTPEGIMFHQVRRRTDDRISVKGADVVDRASVEARAKADARAAAEKAERAALTRRNPVWTTD